MAALPRGALLPATATLGALVACGSTPTAPPARAGTSPVVECGQTLSTSAQQPIPVRDVSAASVDLSSGWLGTDGRPLALRLTSGCAAGAIVVNRTPQLLRLGASVPATGSGVVAVLVYGVAPGTGVLAVMQASGAQTQLRVAVTHGCC